MKKFFSEAIKEFEHVSWPTDAETKKYFTVVVSMIIVLTIVLFIIQSIFSAGLWSLRDTVNPNGTLSPSNLPTTTGTSTTLPDLSKNLPAPATK
jgi:preprotein translocase SecE subunit